MYRLSQRSFLVWRMFKKILDAHFFTMFDWILIRMLIKRTSLICFALDYVNDAFLIALHLSLFFLFVIHWNHFRVLWIFYIIYLQLCRLCRWYLELNNVLALFKFIRLLILFLFFWILRTLQFCLCIRIWDIFIFFWHCLGRKGFLFGLSKSVII